MAGRKLARTSHTPVCACCRYVVRPITGRTFSPRADAKLPISRSFRAVSRSPACAWAQLALKLEPLKATHPFPIGHRGIERVQLDARIVQIVLDDIVAECLARHLGLAEQRRGLGQRGGQPF